MLIAISVALLLVAAAFLLQPEPESLTTAVQAARLSNTVPDSDQRSQESQDGLELAQMKALKNKPEIKPLFLLPNACRLVHDAEGNTVGHCDLPEVSPAVSSAGQSPFSTGQWAAPQVQLRK